MSNDFVLVTLDYPPAAGGVARYLSNLVVASHGQMDVIVDVAMQTSAHDVQKFQLMKQTWPHWWPMIGLFRKQKNSHKYALISHILPVGTAAWIAKIFGGIDYIIIVHGLDLKLTQKSAIKSWLAHQILKKARLVIVNSEYVAHEVERLHRSITPLVLTPGVETMIFPDRNLARKTLGIKTSECIILSVARLIPRKGIDELIRALPKLSQNARLVVIGSGPDEVRLRQLVGTNAHRVLFLTNLSDDERNRWYVASDIFALPVREEADDVEGFGIVYLEAALAGLPVVAGKSGGAPEAVKNNVTGYVVDSLDNYALQTTLERLILDPALREQLGRAGKLRAERDFLWSDRWNNLLQNVCH